MSDPIRPWKTMSELPLVMTTSAYIEVCNVETGARGINLYSGGKPDRQQWRDGWTHWKLAEPMPTKDKPDER